MAIVAGVAVWSALVPTGKRFSDGLMRRITVFGGAFLFGVAMLGLLPEAVGNGKWESAGGHWASLLPYACILAGFLIQQVLEAISDHAEHGHLEGSSIPVYGLMLGLCLHAFLEGMPLVDANGTVNRGLVYGILIHNIPVSLILVGLLTANRMRFWRVLAMLALFGIMSPLGSLFNLYIIHPDEYQQRMIVGVVVGVLLHVSSSILFDHKEHHFSWLNLGLCIVAFALAGITAH